MMIKIKSLKIKFKSHLRQLPEINKCNQIEYYFRYLTTKMTWRGRSLIM